MLSKLLLALVLMGACVVIHAFGMIGILRWVKARNTARSGSFGFLTWRLIRVAAFTVMLHLVQILCWSVAYTGYRAIPDFVTAFYFSAVTYTTTGYGDVVLPEEWRLLGGVEALTGILMCGLSTGMFIAAFSEIFGLKRHSAPASPSSL